MSQIQPPQGWTDDFESMGGEMVWGSDGDVLMLAREAGIEGEIKPHWGTEPYTGEALTVFEAGDGNFFIYNAIEGSVYRIVGPNDAKDIVSAISEDGLQTLNIEQVI